jgi:hypothetical protein
MVQRARAIPRAQGYQALDGGTPQRHSLSLRCIERLLSIVARPVLKLFVRLF